MAKDLEWFPFLFQMFKNNEKRKLPDEALMLQIKKNWRHTAKMYSAKLMDEEDNPLRFTQDPNHTLVLADPANPAQAAAFRAAMTKLSQFRSYYNAGKLSSGFLPELFSFRYRHNKIVYPKPFAVRGGALSPLPPQEKWVVVNEAGILDPRLLEGKPWWQEENIEQAFSQAPEKAEDIQEGSVAEPSKIRSKLRSISR